jgi:hypothetical protein
MTGVIFAAGMYRNNDECASRGAPGIPLGHFKRQRCGNDAEIAPREAP